MLPTLLFDLPVSRPSLVLVCSSMLVMGALSLNEWLFKPRSRHGVFRALGINLVIAVVLGGAGGAAGLKLGHMIDASPLATPPHMYEKMPEPTAALLFGALISIFQVGLWAIIFVIPSADEDRRLHALEVQNLRLEAKELKTESELIRLRAQLEPHFLLNTLNLVAGLVTLDPNKARDVLATLGELLSDALSESRELCTLEEELSWLRRYMDILTARHGSLLQVTWQIDEGAQRALFPRLLLQPLVENAVRHGALRKRFGGKVTVRAERRTLEGRDSLVCTVQDDGPGLGAPREGAIGLENVRRRLALGRPPGELTMHSDESGTTARVVLAYVEENAHDSLADSLGVA